MRSSSSAPVPAKRVWIAAFALLITYAVLAWYCRIPGVSPSNDDAIYVMLAQALRAGSYRELYHLDQPYHTQYPPGWPALLALAGALSGDTLRVSFALVTALATGGLLLFFDAVRRWWPGWFALLALALAVFNAGVLRMGGRLMSEASYFFFSMLALWALAPVHPSGRRQVLATAASIASAFMRSVGLSAIGAVFLWHVARRNWRGAALHGAAAALTLGPWLAWNFIGPRQVPGRSYASDLAVQVSKGYRGIVADVVDRARIIVTGDLPTVLPFLRLEGTPIDNIAWLLILLIFGGLGLVALWRRWRAVSIYLVLYFAVLFAFTWTTRRFLFPVQPLVSLLLLAGAFACTRSVDRRVRLAVILLLVASIAWRGGQQVADLGGERRYCDRSRPHISPGCYDADQRSFFAAAEFARDSLPMASTIMVEREASFAYHSRRRVIHAENALALGDADLLSFLRREHIDYILIGRLTSVEATELPQSLLPHCEVLELVRVFPPRTYLFRVRAANESEARGAACDVLQRLVASSPAGGDV
ncbi:MAG: hypothetical protein ACOY71_13820 [Gemmatimonadota bacterium]